MRTDVKCMIIDDEPNAIEGLKAILTDQFFEEVSVVATANSAIEAVKKMSENEIDLIFLDVNMPGGNGFDFLEIYKERDFEVIFVTADDEFALKAFKVNAIDYLLKPIDINELKNAIEKVKSIRLNKKNQINSPNTSSKKNTEYNKYSITAEGVIRVVDKNKIVVLKGEGNYTTFHLLDNDTQMMSRNLGYFSSDFEEYPFYRCHQSAIINVDEILKITNTDGAIAHMSNGMKVKISRNQKPGLLEILKEKNHA